MYKPILSIICASLLALTLSGCFGIGTILPGECKTDPPRTTARTDIKTTSSSYTMKGDFLRDWGKPNKIITTSEKTEIWIYERHLWCGVVPIFFVPIPLILPVCDGFERIEFDGDDAKSMHVKRNAEFVYLTLMGLHSYFDITSPCWYSSPPEHSDKTDMAVPAPPAPP